MSTTIPESHRDLLQAQFVTLATLGSDGWPQLSEVWFLAQDDNIRISLNTTRQKLKNLQRAPACSLLILDLANPYRYLEIRGHAEIEPDPELTFADAVGTKYGSNRRDMDGPGESRVAVTVRPKRIRAWG